MTARSDALATAGALRSTAKQKHFRKTMAVPVNGKATNKLKSSNWRWLKAGDITMAQAKRRRKKNKTFINPRYYFRGRLDAH